MKIKIKILKRLLTAVIAAVLALSPTMHVMAASNNYISDLRIGYGDEGKAALEAAGYTVWTSLDANKDGNGGSVWIGYKTTNNADEAITDLAVMNMNGGYDFQKYKDKLEELNENVDKMLDHFSDTVEEFRTNYNNGSQFAADALEIMNCLYDEDVTDKDGNYMGVGDVLLDANTSEDTLHKLFLECNTDALTTIEDALALGCVETGDTNIFTRMENVTYPTTLSSENEVRSYLSEVFDDFHQEALLAEETYDTVEDSGLPIKQYLAENADSLSESDQLLILTRYQEYEMLADQSFGKNNNDMTLLDFAMLDKSEPNEFGEVLNDYYLDMMAQCLTPGQKGLVGYIGIMTILMDESAGKNYEDAESAVSALIEEEKSQEKLSVFYGVDRDLFENVDGVALTDEALRAESAGKTSTFGMTSENLTKASILTAATVVSAGISVGLFVAASHYNALFYSITTPAVNVEVHVIGEAATQVATNSTVGTVSLAKACTSAAENAEFMASFCSYACVVAAFITVALLLYTISQWVITVDNKEIVYTEIPRAIVELADDERSFIAYYAVRNIAASDDETDSLKAYGDLNAQNKHDEWVALYYSKNKDRGNPITTNMLVRNSADASISTSKYTAIHNFGETTAANLNQFNTAENVPGVYVYLRTASASSQTGSIFTTGNVLNSLVAFLAGGCIATAATYVVMRKKKTKAEPAK